ncbi:uncharacterized protein LOC123317081 [Coccinella septempunctata]|uniref:uncharacterized protein LOC123317081 n=1 Tax=Coccinella septempunctata TaxID=41139 RepID=UPI001D085852|nr:uncharacterized protein LOC123317081 [Coccinella septempunctata]
MNSLLFGVVFVAFTVSTGNGLECYSCDSSKSSLCNYGIASIVMPTIDCDKQMGDSNPLTSWIPKQCVKLTAKDADGKEFVARGCIPYSGGACDLVMKTLGFFSGLSGGVRDLDCYPCSGDKCNSSITVQPSVAATIILSLLFFFLKL